MQSNNLTSNSDDWEIARDEACAAAREAWEAIRDLYEHGSRVQHKADGPTTEADLLADRIITEHLKARFPIDVYGYLSEETEDDPSRLERDRVWVIDPIDGTKDFIRKSGDFAIHIGLVEKELDGLWRPVAACVYLPVPGEMFSAIQGRGTTLQIHENNTPVGEPVPVHVSQRKSIPKMRAIISRSNRTARLDRFIERMGFTRTRSVGSIGVKLSRITRGDDDFYINFARGRCREWDICAPELILLEAGGALTDLDGRELDYNKPNIQVGSGLIASNALAHAELQRRAARFEAEDAEQNKQSKTNSR